MFDPYNVKNRFGYYSVGCFKTYSKFQALDYQVMHGGVVQWHFNDDIFAQFDWAKEPGDSLQDMYRLRAQHIRDKYDYVVLMYSGGIDSSHMVKVFFDNGIFPDEICSVHEYQGNKNRHAFLTGEIFNSALPFVKANIDERHHTKYRIIDSAEAQFRAVEDLNTDSLHSVMYDWNVAHNLGNLARFDVRRLVPEYKSIMDSGRSLCLVWAECKPKIERDPATGRHQVHFTENGFDMICNAYQQDQNDPTRIDELFYTTPDMPQIVAKQCHLLLSVLRDPKQFAHVMTDKSGLDPVPSRHAPGFKVLNPLHSQIGTIVNNRWLCMKPDVMNSIIYPGTPPILYDQGKNVDRLLHPRDQWLRDKLPEASRRFYLQFLKQSQQYHLPSNFTNDLNKSGKFSVPRAFTAYDLE